MDYIVFCKRFFAATKIPVTLLYNGRPEYSSLGEIFSFYPDLSWNMMAPLHNPSFVPVSSDLDYGRVNIEGTPYDLIVGPFFTAEITEQFVQQYMKDTYVPPEHREAMAELLPSIPSGSHVDFVRWLLFLNLCLNQKDTDIQELYSEDEQSTQIRHHTELETAIENKEIGEKHNSYLFETQVYAYIRQGEPSRLKAFLEKVREYPHEGRRARTPLRQAKNIMIGITEKAGVLGAIPGGVDEERVYQLIDLYVLECEQLQSVEEVHRLQYIMLMDFCRRVGEAQLPDGISAEVYRCMNYIISHTNENISIDNVAAQINRSSSYLMRHFKQEMGMSVGAYITKCKLEEAKNLLTFSERSLAEISAYLGYTSQSHFQNVFKKQYGITPMQYRKQSKKGIGHTDSLKQS